MSGDYATQTCLHTKMEISREFCLPKINGGRFKHFDRAVGCYEGLSGPVTVLQITPSTRLMPSTYRRSKFLRNLGNKGWREEQTQSRVLGAAFKEQ